MLILEPIEKAEKLGFSNEEMYGEIPDKDTHEWLQEQQDKQHDWDRDRMANYK